MTPSWPVLARNARCRGAPKSVLLVLSTYADAAGVCSPTQTELSDGAGVDVRTIRTSITDLERLGLIAVERDARGPRFYRLLLAASRIEDPAGGSTIRVDGGGSTFRQPDPRSGYGHDRIDDPAGGSYARVGGGGSDARQPDPGSGYAPPDPDPTPGTRIHDPAAGSPLAAKSSSYLAAAAAAAPARAHEDALDLACRAWRAATDRPADGHTAGPERSVLRRAIERHGLDAVLTAARWVGSAATEKATWGNEPSWLASRGPGAAGLAFGDRRAADVVAWSREWSERTHPPTRHAPPPAAAAAPPGPWEDLVERLEAIEDGQQPWPVGATREHPGELVELWEAIHGRLKLALPPDEVRVWFGRARCGGYTDEELIVEVPNRYYADWIATNYGRQLAAAAEAEGSWRLRLVLAPVELADEVAEHDRRLAAIESAWPGGWRSWLGAGADRDALREAWRQAYADRTRGGGGRAGTAPVSARRAQGVLPGAVTT